MNKVKMNTRLATALALIAAVPAITACGSSATGSSGGGGRLNLVAYSTPKEAYAALIPAFNKTAAGSGVSFTQSFGPSGDQERAVEAGGGPRAVVVCPGPGARKPAKAREGAPHPGP